MSSIIARARINAQKKPIYDINRSHYGTWREQVKQRGDMVKLSIVKSFMGLRDRLHVEFDVLQNPKTPNPQNPSQKSPRFK